MVPGLSVAEVIEVKGRSIILGGADIVDGSPVLDIKPYLPFCDSLSQAIAPLWVRICPVTSIAHDSESPPVFGEQTLESTPSHQPYTSWHLEAEIPYISIHKYKCVLCSPACHHPLSFMYGLIPKVCGLRGIC